MIICLNDAQITHCRRKGSIGMLRLENVERRWRPTKSFVNRQGPTWKRLGIEWVVADPANVEKAVAGLAKFKPAAANTEVNC